jgi:GrpB-like predicted nucleotidyltransferase (UPF0157 family)
MLIQKYTSQWIQDFAKLKAEIENAWRGTHYPIEHVGSTAVPGLDAKAIIDIDIIYSGPEDFDTIKAGLIQIGYFNNGHQGIAGRDVFKRNGNQTHVILDTIPHHLYVCLANSAALERHLLFRDQLRKNEEARLIYQQMKYELAEKAGQDKKIYAALKEIHINPFVDAVIGNEKKDHDLW